MADELAVADEFTLPPETVTQCLAILGKRGTGKSNIGVVLAEEFHRLGIPWVAIDPKGDWWGVRSMADGSPGLSVPVLGGLHGDVPLEPTAGKLVANLIADRSLTCVLDVSEFDSKAAQSRFLTDLAETLLRRNTNPLHLFLEEADEYLPQMVRGDVAKMVGAWQKVVKRGRFRGLGCTLITQRSAALNKDVLNMVDGLLVTQTTAPGDRDVALRWIGDHLGDEVDAHTIRASLPTLRPGQAWVWLPPAIVQAVAFRRRATFDSGETPKLGKVRRAATLADVDLDVVKAQMAETVERAKRDDPALLRARIRDLENEAKTRTPAEKVEVPVEVTRWRVPPGLADLLVGAQTVADEYAGVVRSGAEEQRAKAEGFRAQVHILFAEAARLLTATEAEIPVAAPLPKPARRAVRAVGPGAMGAMNAQEEKFLGELAKRHPMQLTESQLATMTGYSRRSSQFKPTLRALAGRGLITPWNAGGRIGLTDAGIDATGAVEVAGPMTVDAWSAVLPGHAAKFLRVLHKARTWMASADIAAAAGYSPTSSTVPEALRVLADNGLVTRGADGGWLVDDDQVR